MATEIIAITGLEHPYLQAPIIRIDALKREVEGVATSEAVDSYGTIFSYEASKKAFQTWIERTANVREMHDRKAVAKGIGVQFDDENKKIFVRTRVSRAAQDTWTKLEEGILSGFSVGAVNPVWGKTERNGKMYPYLTSYDLAELSYVDNASNPDGQGLALCRADGLTELVDTTENEPEETAVEVVATPENDVERAGAMHSKKTRDNLHAMRDTAIQTCADGGCEDCAKIQSLGNGEQPERALSAELETLIQTTLERMMAPIYQRQQLVLARLATSQHEQPDFTAIQQRMDTFETNITAALERANSATSIEKVLAELSAVKVDVERIAAQPASGGPILNGAHPASKQLATDRRAFSTSDQGETTMDVLSRLQRTGAFDTMDKQVAAAALAVVPTRGRG